MGSTTTPGICGQAQTDGTICTNAAGCRVRHPIRRNPIGEAVPVAASTDGGYGDELPSSRDLSARRNAGRIDVSIRWKARDFMLAKDAIRTIPGRAWDAERKVWTLPDTPETVERLRLIAAGDYRLPPPTFGAGKVEGTLEIRSRMYDDPVITQLRSWLPLRWDKGRKVWVMPEPRGESGWDELRRRAEKAGAAVPDEMIPDFGVAKIVLPADALALPLYEWQIAGAEFLTTERGAILADEPGLGKTFAALAAAEATDSYPLVVACPAFLRTNWLRECRRALPERNAVVLSPDTEADADVDGADIVIVGYETLERFEDRLPARPGGFVCDESHYLKSWKAKRAQAAERIAATVSGDGLVAAMTGTPIISKHADLLPTLRIIGRIHAFGNTRKYLDDYCYLRRGHINTWDGANNGPRLHDKLHEGRIMLRRRKTALPGLPPKLHASAHLDLPPDGRRIYDLCAARCKDALDGFHADPDRFLGIAADNEDADDDEGAAAGARSVTVPQIDAAARAEAVEVLLSRAHLSESASPEEVSAAFEGMDPLQQITLLRRVASLVKLPVAARVARDRLAAAASENGKIVVFAHHRRAVELLAAELDAPMIYGGMSHTARQGVVDDFSAEDGPRAVVCSVAAAGVGLNLQRASRVLFVESPWTPAECEQAEDRCHRIGQTETVNVEYLHAADTIDAHIAAVVARKRRIADQVTGDRTSR